MFDLLAAAYQADVSRVFTFMMSREISQRTYPQIGITEQHHTVSHHTNNADKMAKVVVINTYYAGLFAKFLEKLRATQEADGSLFDRCMIVYGAGMGDSNSHASGESVARRSGPVRQSSRGVRGRDRNRRWFVLRWPVLAERRRSPAFS